MYFCLIFFFFQAEDGIRDVAVTGVQTCALPISEVKARQNTNAAERARLSRLKRVVPLVKLIDADLARLDSLGTFPNTPAGFEERLRASLETARKAEDMRERAQRDEARAIQDHADIVLDEALVEKSGDVRSEEHTSELQSR